MKILILALTALSLFSSPAFAFGKKRQKVAVDTVTQSTIIDGDATGLAEGCGQQPSPLGMFCRMVEGDIVGKSVQFIGPPADCAREACVFVKVFNNQGQLVFGDSIPKGKTRLDVPWKTLLGREKVEFEDRGFWSFTTSVFYIDLDGRERESKSQGDIVLRVFRKGYAPLSSVKNDPNFVWSWVDSGYLYKMTSGLRTFVSKVN